MPSESIVTGFWQYGWARRDTVELAVSPSDAGLIEQYVASISFQTTFLDDDYHVGVHGPFIADRIRAEDYVPLHSGALDAYLKTFQLAKSITVNTGDLTEVRPHLEPAFAEGRRCYVLTLDESSRELFHEWGYIFDLFREFLFVGPEPDTLKRIVIAHE